MNLLPELMQMIVNSISSIQNFEYMEFVNDFMITYAHILNEQVGIIAQATVSRIHLELTKKSAGNSSIFVQKCMNILK